MSYTKAPWIIKHDYNVESKGGRSVANTAGYSNNVNPEKVREENMANARLIAAAPELLELCEEAVVALYEGYSADPIQTSEKLQAMIKKLTGRVFNTADEVFKEGE